MATTIDPNDPNVPLDQLQAYYAEQNKADEEAFAKARADIEAMAAQEQAVIRQQADEYQAAQQRIYDETQAQAQAAALEQAKMQKQIEEIKAQQAADAAKNKADIEGIQRTSAQKLAASRKAGRTAGGRPLLSGVANASMGQPTQKLGGEGSLAGDVASLGATQTLGV